MQSQTTYFQVLIGIMNELQVIGSLRLRKDFWDRHRANTATVKSEMGAGIIDTRVARNFVQTTVKYVVKFSGYLFSMPKNYEIHKYQLKLPRNNSMRHFLFYLQVLPLPSFLLAW